MSQVLDLKFFVQKTLQVIELIPIIIFSDNVIHLNSKSCHISIFVIDKESVISLALFKPILELILIITYNNNVMSSTKTIRVVTFLF